VTVLLAVVTVVAVGAAARLISGAGHVPGLPVLVASGAAALVMLAGGLILRGDDDAPGDSAGDQVNMRAVLLDTLADSAAAAGVAITGAIILADPALSWLDPAIALVIAAVVGYHALRLAREVIATLSRAPPAPPPVPPPPLHPPPASH
jgi:cobalt-zinc-cadmium efflux system protein